MNQLAGLRFECSRAPGGLVTQRTSKFESMNGYDSEVGKELMLSPKGWDRDQGCSKVRKGPILVLHPLSEKVPRGLKELYTPLQFPPPVWICLDLCPFHPGRPLLVVIPPCPVGFRLHPLSFPSFEERRRFVNGLSKE